MKMIERIRCIAALCALGLALLWVGPVLAGPQEAQREETAQSVRERYAAVEANFWTAYRAGAWEKAIALGMELETMWPGQSRIAYNLACLHCLAGRDAETYQWLESALERGFTDVSIIEGDKDFARIRAQEKFQAIVKQVVRNFELEREAIRQLFEEHPPRVVVPPEHDPKKPTGVLISLHGYGGRATGYPLYWRSAAAKHGLILAAPQAVHRVEGTVGYAWGDLYETEYLMDLTLEALKDQFKVDETKIIISGFSQGGFLAAALAARNPERYFGSIPMAGPHYTGVEIPKKRPFADTPRFYFMVGSSDRLKPDAEQASKHFKKLGYDVAYHVFESAGHTYPVRCHYELNKALEFILEGGADADKTEEEKAPQARADEA
jgi:predicted esterase